jgi:hypothetical protein
MGIDYKLYFLMVFAETRTGSADNLECSRRDSRSYIAISFHSPYVESIAQTAVLCHLAQQQQAAVRTYPAAIKAGHHLTPTKTLEFELACLTLCLHRPALPALKFSCGQNNFLAERNERSIFW